MHTPLFRNISESASSRRSFLGAIGALGVIGLAGCLSAADDGDQDDGHTDHDDETHEHDSHAHDHDRARDYEVQADLTGPGANADVAMMSDGGHHFAPRVVWIERGGTVAWELASGAHDTVAYHPENSDLPLRIPEDAEPWDSEMLMTEGAAVEITFDVEGVYDYFCSPHQFRGMVGSVIVGTPDPAEQSGLEPPQEDLPREARAMLKVLNETARDALEAHD